LARDILAGDVDAQLMLGVTNRADMGNGARPLEAAKWFRKAADQGSAKGQNDLGEMYMNGEGLSQSYEEAAKWFHKAADQDYAEAQLNLGNLYHEGHGVSQDNVEAAKWIRKAADQGNSRAQYNLGILYLNGTGVIQDYLMAHMYTNLAAAQGQENAEHNREAIARKMTPDQIGKAQQMARDWMEEHQSED